MTNVMTNTPISTGRPQHDYCYRIEFGTVEKVRIEEFRLHKNVADHMIVSSSPVSLDSVRFLPTLSLIASRIAPWVDITAVPWLATRVITEGYGQSSIVYHQDGHDYYPVGGIANCSDTAAVVLILLRFDPPSLAEMLFHELFHVVWYHLSDDAVAVLSSAVSSGPDYDSHYYSCVEERAARLFGAWALARLEGLPAPQVADDLSVEGIFELVYSGALADALIVAGEVPDHEAMMVIRGLVREPVADPTPEPTKGRLQGLKAMFWPW